MIIITIRMINIIKIISIIKICKIPKILVILKIHKILKILWRSGDITCAAADHILTTPCRSMLLCFYAFTQFFFFLKIKYNNFNMEKLSDDLYFKFLFKKTKYN